MSGRVAWSSDPGGAESNTGEVGRGRGDEMRREKVVGAINIGS